MAGDCREGMPTMHDMAGKLNSNGFPCAAGQNAGSHKDSHSHRKPDSSDEPPCHLQPINSGVLKQNSNLPVRARTFEDQIYRQNVS